MLGLTVGMLVVPAVRAGAAEVTAAEATAVADRVEVAAVADIPRHDCAGAAERCDGTLQVPLNWEDPASPPFTVGFAFVPRADTSQPAAGTIMASPGGPGESIPAVPAYQQALGSLTERYNLLVVDPRGFGTSSPVTCEQFDVERPETLAACAEQLGERAAFISGDQYVADVDAVRAALGLEQLTFYGNSYGSLYAQAYASRFPEHTRALVLSSVVRPDEHGFFPFGNHRTIPAGLGMLDRLCEPSAACQALPGSPRERFAALLDRLRATPDPQVPIGVLDFLLVQVSDPAVGRTLNAAVAAYLDGDPAPLRRLTAPLAATEGQGDTDPGWFARLANTCNDGAFPFDRNASAEERSRQLDAYVAEEQPYAPFTAEEVRGDPADRASQCVHWPTPRDTPPLLPDADPDVPVLAYSGELDPVTPSPDAVEVAGGYPRGTGLDVPGGGHSLGTTPAPGGVCVLELTLSFMEDPRHPVEDPGCSYESYHALGSFPRTARELPPARDTGLDDAGARRVAAAFATVADALTRRDPNGGTHPRRPDEPGLRGGQVRYDDEAGTITLEGARFVENVAVTGQVTRNQDGTVSADLRLGGGGRPAAVQLTWTPFQPRDSVQVGGTLDGRRFDGQVPLP